MRLRSQKETFFDLFNQHAAHLVTICEELRDMFRDFDHLPERLERIRDLEHRCDDITHEVARRMHATFVTPLDKEDIRAIASGLDDVVDYADAAGDRVVLYQLSESSPHAHDLSVILVAAGKVLQGAVADLRGRREAEKILTACREIHRLENESDVVYRRGLGELFNAPGADPIHVLKWREIYERLEMAVDKCEDVANVLEGIQLKYG